jgi:hypothetical protein
MSTATETLAAEVREQLAGERAGRCLLADIVNGCPQHDLLYQVFTATARLDQPRRLRALCRQIQKFLEGLDRV